VTSQDDQKRALRCHVQIAGWGGKAAHPAYPCYRTAPCGGGGSIYYHTGKYTCSGGKWKGQVTTREHVPEQIPNLFARKIVTMGFTGTYNDEGAEFEATALVGKRSARLHVVFRLLVADGSETD